MLSGNLGKIEILLVEDNPGDVRLIVETLKDGRKDYGINVIKDGDKVLDFLQKKGEYINSPKPDIILLDLKLPGKSGIEVLKEIKEDEILKVIPVIVLTSSSAERDMAAAYKNHANCYITKPIDLNKFVVTIQSIEEFWFTIIKKQQ